MRNYNIEIREFNGTDYDVLYPVTKAENILGLNTLLQERPVLKIFTTTLNTTWSGDGINTLFSKKQTINGVLSTDHIIYTLNGSTTFSTAVGQSSSFKYIDFAIPSNNAITFYCSTNKPVVSLPLKIFVFRFS